MKQVFFSIMILIGVVICANLTRFVLGNLLTPVPSISFTALMLMPITLTLFSCVIDKKIVKNGKRTAKAISKLHYVSLATMVLLIIYYQYRICKELNLTNDVNQLFINNDMASSLLSVVVIVFIGPLAEERFFRGTLWNLLAEIPKTMQSSITCIFFILFHIPNGRFGVIVVIFPAILFTLARSISASIIPSMVLHILFNAVRVFLVIQVWLSLGH